MNIDQVRLEISSLPSLPLEQKNSLPNIAAIYFVLSSEGEVLYIGQTINLWQRWVGRHHCLIKLKNTDDICISWLIVSDLTLLDEIERGLIKHFLPPHNKVGTKSKSEYPVKSIRDLELDVYLDFKHWAEKHGQTLGLALTALMREKLAEIRHQELELQAENIRGR